MKSAALSPPPASTKDNRDHSLYGKVRRAGWPLVEALYNIGLGARFALALFARSAAVWRRPRIVMQHLKTTGVYTLVIVAVAGLFIGFVLGLQFYVQLARFGQQEFLSPSVALTLFRELGPVATGLLFVGCACTSITASIGLKKASEQIAAMEVMAVDSLSRELAPRLWAGMIALPILTIYFDVVGILGCYLITVVQIGLDEGLFWSGMKEHVGFVRDFLQGIFKSVFFGVITVIIALYEGYFCIPTAEGVARATTRTVVKGSLAVLGLNFVLTAFMIN